MDQDSTERLTSPPPDYNRAMSAMSLNQSGRGPLDDVPGIPRRGESNMLEGLMGRDFTQSDDNLGAAVNKD